MLDPVGLTQLLKEIFDVLALEITERIEKVGHAPLFVFSEMIDDQFLSLVAGQSGQTGMDRGRRDASVLSPPSACPDLSTHHQLNFCSRSRFH